MEKNFVGLVNEEKNKLEILKERYQSVIADVKGLGNYFVENITARNADLYNELLDLKRIYENVENIICMNSYAECYYERLSYLNTRFEKKLEEVESGINRIATNNYKYTLNIQK